MLSQVVMGLAIVVVTIVITAVFIGFAEKAISTVSLWLMRPPYISKTIIALSIVATWLLMAIAASIWIWAIAFVAIDQFETWESAVYFSLVCFTTVGFGDIVLDQPWRILSGICAANGLLNFGICAAFVIELFARLHSLRTNGHAS